MNILNVVTPVLALASSFGAGAVVGNAIKATTPDNLKIVSKVLVGIGGVVLASVAGDAAATYIDREIKNMATSFKVGNKLGEDLSVKMEEAFRARADRTADKPDDQPDYFEKPDGKTE